MEHVERHADLIADARILCFDPSSGSAGSLPGFAEFERGQLIDYGTVELPKGTRAIQNRLYLLRETLQKEFQRPDILVVELISPVMPISGNKLIKRSGASSLLKAVGVIMSVWDVPLIEVAPVSWQALLPEGKGYAKSDIHDAIALGNAVYTALARLRDVPPPDLYWPEIGVT